jgi:hypothetical protein
MAAVFGALLLIAGVLGEVKPLGGSSHSTAEKIG